MTPRHNVFKWAYIASFCASSLFLWYNLAFESFAFKGFLFHLALTFGISVVIFESFHHFNLKKTFFFFNIFITVYWLINIGYFDLSKSYLTFRTFYHMSLEGLIAIHEGYNPFKFQYLIYLIPLVISVFILISWDKIKDSQIFWKRKGLWFGSLALVPVIFAFMFYRGGAIANFKATDQGRCVYVYRFGILTYQILHFLYSDEKSFIEQLDKKMAPPITKEKDEGGEKPNFVMIQIETLNANIINQKYNDNFVTPYLNQLAHTQVYFPYLLSYHFASRSADADFSVLNATEPLSNYPVIALGDYGYENSIVKQLNMSGYTSKAFHNNTGMFMYRFNNFAKMGFEKFYDLKSLNIPQKSWGGTDGDLFEKVGEAITLEKKPFFYYVITLTSHTPFDYYRHVPFENNAYNKISDKMTRDYFKSMSYVDLCLSKFVEEARKIPNTYIFIYGDHTSGTEIENSILKNSYYIDNNMMYEFVPLLIITPEGKKHIETENAVIFPDISKTVLDLARMHYKIKTYGQNLFESLENKDIPFLSDFYSRKKLFDQIKKETHD